MHKFAKWVLWVSVVTGTAIAILILVAPLVIRSSGVNQAVVCQNNLRQIEAVIDLWAFEKHLPAGTLVTTNDIMQCFQYGFPQCPIGGHYTLTKVGETLICSMPTNAHKIVY